MPHRTSSTHKGFSASRFAQFFLVLFLLTFPFQIRSLFFNLPFFPTGNFNEYSSFFLFLSDLFLFVSFFFYGVALSKGQVDRFRLGPCAPWLLLLILMGVITSFFAEFPALALLQSARFAEMFLLYLLVVNQVLGRSEILRYFLYGMMFQGFAAMFQYLLQSSVGLRFLGEPILGPEIPGVAKVDFEGQKFLRAYGTFLHPNVLGGFMAVSFFWAVSFFERNRKFGAVLLGVFTVGLVLSFSRSAMLAFFLVFLFFIFQKKVKWNFLVGGGLLFFCVALFFTQGLFFERFFMGNDPAAAVERLQYLDAGAQMFFDHPFGVGLGHFTLALPDYASVKLDPWLLQPVHNVFLLVLNELGLLGGAVFVSFLLWLFVQLFRAKAHIPLAVLGVITLISVFDHYFFTLYPGQVVMFLFFGLASSFLNRSLLPRKKS